MNNTASTTNTNKRQGIDDSSKTLPKKQKLSVEEKRKIIQDKKAKLAESIASLTSKGVIQSDQTFSLKSMPIHPSLLKDAKFVPSKFSTTLANKNQLDLLAIKQLPIPVVVTKQVTETQFLKLQRKDPYFDRSLNSHAVSAPLKHAYRPMTFLAPGKYIRDASIQRKEEEEKNQLEIIAFKSFNTDSMKKDTFIGVKIRHHLLVPEIEWWDAPFLKGGHYPTAFQNVDDMNSDLITGLIHHPIPALLVAKKVTPVIQKVILTQKETKKLRRISRLEAQKERQERQRMGLEKEQVDKLKFSNFMRVVGEEAVSNPTLIEARVKEQTAGRLVKSILHDKEKQLTKEERSLKNQLKLVEDLRDGINNIRVKDMSDPSNRFKVSMNAKQYNLTGCSIKYTNMNIVCVQGGPKSQKQYKKLMLRRIDWSGKKKRGEDDDQDDNQHQVGQQGQLQQSEWCMICWEGVIEKPNFKFFVDKEFFTEAEALEFLNSKGVGSYWDTAKSYVQA